MHQAGTIILGTRYRDPYSPKTYPSLDRNTVPSIRVGESLSKGMGRVGVYRSKQAHRVSWLTLVSRDTLSPGLFQTSEAHVT